MAPAQGKDLLNEVNRFFGRVDVGVGAKVVGAVFFDLAGDLNDRVALVGDFDVGIPRPPLKLNVVVGLVFLNQGDLQLKGFLIGGGDDRFEVGHFFDHRRHLPRVARLEVGPYPVL